MREKRNKIKIERGLSEGNVRSNGFYTLLANRFFTSIKELFIQYYIQNSNYGKLQIILLIIQVLIFAILIIQHLKDL